MHGKEIEKTQDDCVFICERRRAIFAFILAVSILGSIYGGIKVVRDMVVTSETSAR